MHAVLDLLRRVDALDAASLLELEARNDDGFLAALDVAVDHGLVRLVGYAHGDPGCYRLTRRGRLILTAAAASIAAA